MKLENTYTLYGFIIAKSWMGGYGIAHLAIRTIEGGYRKIKEDPCQDYLNFGVEYDDKRIMGYSPLKGFWVAIYKNQYSTGYKHNIPDNLALRLLEKYL